MTLTMITTTMTVTPSARRWAAAAFVAGLRRCASGLVGRGWVVILALVGLGAAHQAAGQAVLVTARLDTNVLSVGQSTTLRVFAQVTPNLRSSADRIFSWYVDVLNTNGAAAGALYDQMVKPASDNFEGIATNGVPDGPHRRGIHDTFLELPGAGVSNAVELMAIPVVATAAGTTRFSVQAGSGDPFLSEDFIVAPKTGDVPFTGGDYLAAGATLTVTGGCEVRLQIQKVSGDGSGGRLQLSFTPCPGRVHTVEMRSAIDSGTWQAVAGAPHNSGAVTVTNTQPRQFFRVRIE